MSSPSTMRSSLRSSLRSGFASLRVRVLVPLLVALGCTTALLSIDEYNRSRMATRYGEVIAMREALDRTLQDIEDRHTRSVRRAHEALRDTRGALAALQWISQHYLKDVERLVSEAGKVVDSIALSDADPRLEGDLGRLRKQLERVQAEAQALSPAFAALIDASSADDREAAQRNAEQDLDRADRSVIVALRIAEGMIRSTCTWQAWHAITPPVGVPWPISWLVMAFLPLSIWLASRPLGRLRELALGHDERSARRPTSAGDARRLSREETALSDRLAAAEVERTELFTRLTERGRDLERGQQLTRRIEHELALLKFYNENLVNSLRSAIVVTDAAGVITAINRVARAFLAMDEASVGQPIEHTALFRALGERVRDGRQELQHAMEERRALRYEAVSYPLAQRTALLDLTLAPYQDETGAARGLLWVADDVTDAVQTKHQLLLAERLAAVGRLSAQVAHEIRNPLSAIGLNAELLEEEFSIHLDPKRGAEARELLHAIAAEIERLTEVTEAYLQLARLPHPNVRQVDLNQLINELFVMLREEMKAHHITVLLDLATPSPAASLDPGQLRQALINIIRNSREAMPDGGGLRVSTRREDHACVTEVCDTGPGIPDDVLPRVFEPFYSTKPHGTGLGLSLTHQIVTEHGGMVQISRGVPHGTCVTITIPDAADPG